MGTLSKTVAKTILIIVITVFTAGILSGCANTEVNEATEFRWVIFVESILIMILVVLVVLLLVFQKRYKRVAKRATEADMRERSLKEENEMLSHLDRMKTEFLQNMSHDFKTPLTIISTTLFNAADMLNYELDKDELKESLDLAQSEVKRMARIIDNAMKQTILYNERKNLESIDLTRFLKKLEKTYRVYLSRHGNSLKVQVPKTLPEACYNSDVLLNIFSNLISNANRYTRKGTITISAEMAEDQIKHESGRKYISIAVKDTGMGVDPMILPNVFKRGASSKQTGLGLNICKSTVESFGGIISMESKQGVGTTVTFTIPSYAEE